MGKLQIKDGVRISHIELDLVKRIAAGGRPTDMGAELAKSSRTIENQLKHLRGKVGVKTIPELVALFMRNKLIE